MRRAGLVSLIQCVSRIDESWGRNQRRVGKQNLGDSSLSPPQNESVNVLQAEQ